jgi:urease alpha subunit
MFNSGFMCVCLCLLIMLPQSPQFDLLIKGGRVVDGSGRAAYVADVGIKDDRIVRLGNLSQATAARTIDAQVSWLRLDSSTCWANPKPIS